MGVSALVLIGPPGAGCTTVAQEWGQTHAAQIVDLREQVARQLHSTPDLALIAVGEDRYRQVETELARSELNRLDGLAPSAHRVLALGSGALGNSEIRQQLSQLRDRGVQVVSLSATTRTLAHRNGLDAPRSVALGNVNHAFTLMLHERERVCRELANVVIDTTDTTPAQAAAQIPPTASAR